MKKQKAMHTNTLLRFDSMIRRTFMLFLVFMLGGFWLLGTISSANAVTTQTSQEYCAKYVSKTTPPDNTKYNACRDGLLGKECTVDDYPDADIQQICLAARQTKASGGISDTPVYNGNTGGSSSGGSNSSSGSSSSGSTSQQDKQDNTSTLSQLLDVLHQGGPDAKKDLSDIPDNNYGSYVNGAGQQQALTVMPSGVPNGPAILFFNGGGWHGNDQTGELVAAGSPVKNGIAELGEFAAPAGGGAIQRGYTAIDVTYRLGSSGVYYMFEDVMRGVKHVRDNAKLYNIDPNKIVIWGDSAGGSLSMRAAASGKSGAKAAVGWSAPTNGYTGLFKSLSSFLIGMDHSTCIPTDLAGAANITSLLTGGSGKVAEYGTGLSNNSLDSFTNGNPLGLITDALYAVQNAATTGKNIESISAQIQSGGLGALSGGIINVAANKIGECIDNFNALSPALFASPDSPPSFLAGFDSDTVVDPQQLYGMRDKLRSLGIRSNTLVIPGNRDYPDPIIGPSPNHLGYDPRFVCETINFLDRIVQPDKPIINCGTGVPVT